MKGFLLTPIAALLLGACSVEDYPPCTPGDEGAGAGGPGEPDVVTVGVTAGVGGFGYTSDGERYGYSRNAAGQVCACDARDNESQGCVDTPPGDDAVVQGYPCPNDRVNASTGECLPSTDPGAPDSPTGSGSAGVSDQEALLQKYLDDGHEAGGILCGGPAECVKKCVAEAKYCWAEHAGHPYKPEQIGDLYDCIDAFPKAKYGGSYTCLYRYPNGDACIFAYGAKLGPITLPAPPPLCSYKGG